MHFATEHLFRELAPRHPINRRQSMRLCFVKRKSTGNGADAVPHPVLAAARSIIRQCHCADFAAF
jgi:hypothetical protein